MNCNDGDPCTTDSCEMGACVNVSCAECCNGECCEGEYTCCGTTNPVCCDPDRCFDEVCCGIGATAGGDTCYCNAIDLDLVFSGVSEDEEENPGAFVSTWEEQGELLPGLTLKAGSDLTGSVTFEVTGATGGIQLYQDAQGTTVLPLFNQTIPVSQLPKTFYVAGHVVSPAARDIQFKLTYNLADMECDDIVKLTVLELKLKSLTFTTDHDLIRDNLTDFEPTGDVFLEPKWQADREPYEDFPISHSMGQNVGIDARFELLPFGSNPPNLALSTQGPQGFHFQQEVSLPGGDTTVSLISTDQVEQRIQRIDQNSIEWTIRLDGRTFLRKVASPYRIFVTMGAPRNTSDPRYFVTWNRMNRAVQIALLAKSMNPHAIVQELVWTAGPYDLDAGDLPNAWQVPDFGGDCQLIVRFGIKVANMIDLPGEYEHTNIYAIETSPTVAIEGSPYDGLGYPERIHPTEPWVLRLIDRNGGCNGFEATIKYSCGFEPRYFPGGVRAMVFDDKDAVLGIFGSLSWKTGVCSVQENVYLYSDPIYNPAPPPCP